MAQTGTGKKNKFIAYNRLGKNQYKFYTFILPTT
jgi:hypothetical protein